MATISLRNTKNDIFKGYKVLLEESSKLKTKLSAIEKSLRKSQEDLRKANTRVKAAGKPITKTVTVEKIVERVATADTVKGIIGILSSVQEGIGVAINQCSGMQVIEAEKLAELQEKIGEHTKELKDLYDLEISFGNGTLDDLIKNYEEEQRTFNEAFKAKREDFEEEFATKKRIWKKEQETNKQNEQERKSLDIKTINREKTEYEYALKLERNNEDDIYAQKRKALRDELTEVEELKQEVWKEKEKSVKEKEEEFDKYKKEFEELPSRLSKAVKKAEYEGTAIIERDAKVKLNMFKKDVESNQKANELKIKGLERLIDQQESQIEDLSNQLFSALQQAQALAIKAIEGSANTDSFAAIKAIAMEQAKHITKSK